MSSLGKLGDVMNPKTFLLTGQFMTGIIFGTIGLAHHYEVNHRMFILAMMILNGIAQSPTWPGVVTIIDNWFPKKGKIIVMGIS
jgi:sugar phosphate permease